MEQGLFRTKDLALATYVKMHGLTVTKASRQGRDYEFLFADPDGKAEKLRYAFANSECQKFDYEMRTLKILTSAGANHNNGRRQ